MTIVVFECDICNRQIEKLKNEEGLEVIKKCNITLGCKGNLHKVNELTGYVSPSLPPAVSELTDWEPRNILYTHTQDLLAETWSITHNLNTDPLFQVFVYVNDELVEFSTSDITATLINPNQINIEFTQAYTGIVQLIARSSTDRQTVNSFQRTTENVVNQNIQITTNNILTIATLYGVTNVPPVDDFLDISIVFLEPNTFVENTISGFIFDAVDIESPWNNIQFVSISGRLYKVRSAIIDPLLLTNIRNGSPFYFSDIVFGSGGSPTPIASNDIFILESDPPYQLVDKQYNRAIDMSRINSNVTTLTSFRNQELFINEELFTNIFPHITPIEL